MPLKLPGLFSPLLLLLIGICAVEASQSEILLAAIQEYIDSQIENAERPESHFNLGNMYLDSGKLIEAEKAYLQAIKLDPKFGPAYANLADLYSTQGMHVRAGEILKSGIRELPENAPLFHARGLLEVRNQKMDLALSSLKKASELAPETARYTYVYGVALSSAGRSAEALDVLEQGYSDHRRDPEIIFMIASINRDLGDKEQALLWAQKLLAINPADQNAKQFIEMLQGNQ